MNELEMFQVSLEDLCKNKFYLMKQLGMSIQQIDKLPYYEFENLTKNNLNNNERRISKS